MDKRSWPWKKKASDKSLSASFEPGESSPTLLSRSLEDQNIAGMSHQQMEERIRHLNDKLLAANDLVRQHVKVAEEAVSGWEKSKSECVSLKQQLDALVEQKQILEDRVLHLDGALKECTWQLRHVREEQEHKIHEAIVKKTRDWDNTRLELEGRLADTDQQLSEAGRQNAILYKTMQEQAETITELSLARSQAESDIEMLQIRIEAFEKENGSLKYEVLVLNKELEIRNHEKEMNKRSADAANKKHLEHVRKISKLENECQRLRVLVRKKLPGPGALAQMKMEVEGLDIEKFDTTRWKFGSKVPGSPKASFMEPAQKSENSLSERLLTMEEETKMLKEALAKRNIELQAARIMYTKTADKVSMLESQLTSISQSQKSPRKPFFGSTEASISLSVSKEPSQGSMSEDGDDRSCVDSWASALITELAHFPKEKLQQNANKALDRLDSLDDFLEVERLVSFSPRKRATGTSSLNQHSDRLETSSNLGAQVETTVESSEDLSDRLLKKEAELEAANKLCKEVCDKLAKAEENLNVLQSKNAANELNLYSLHQRLTMIAESKKGDFDPEKLLELVENAVAAAQCSSVDGLRDHVMKLSKVSSPGHDSNLGFPEGRNTTTSAESSPPEQSSPSRDTSAIGPELTSAVCKVVRLIEGLALAASTKHLVILPEESSNSASDLDADNHHIFHPEMNGNPVEIDASTKNFTSVSNSFLHGKVELVQFMAELSSVLGHISKVAVHSMQDRSSTEKSNHEIGDQPDVSVAESPVADTSKPHVGKGVIPIIARTNEITGLKEPHVLGIEEEVRKLRSEKSALESHMRAEFSRLAGIEELVAQLKQEKYNLEVIVEEEKDKVEAMRGQLHDAEQLVANLRVRLASAEISKNMADDRLSLLSAVKSELEAQLKDKEMELNQMNERQDAVLRSLTQEQLENKELHLLCKDLEQRLQSASLICSSCGASLDGTNSKDQEIADATQKLAECQRTILVLGRQLKDLASPKNSMFNILDVNMDQEAMVAGLQAAEIDRHESQLKGDSQRSGRSYQDGSSPNCEHIDINTRHNFKQRVSSDPGHARISDVTDDALISAANGLNGSGRKMSDLFGAKSPVHEDYIEAAAQTKMPPDLEADQKIVKYVPKPASKKNARTFAGIEFSKSLNLAPSSSPHKHGNSLSRFFSRNKK